MNSENKTESISEDKVKRFDSKKLRYGTLATAITAIVIVVVVLINVIVGIVMDKYPLKADLTANKIYEVSEKTINYLEGIKSDVEIVVMSDETLYKANSNYKKASEVLEKYAKYSDKIKVKYVDMQRSPDEFAKYNDKFSGDITENNVVIASVDGSKIDKIRVVTTESLFIMEPNYATQQYDVVGFQAEQILTSAVMYVTDANPKKVAFINAQPHATNMDALNSLATAMDSNGYIIELVDLKTQELTNEYNMAILLAPKDDLTETEVDKLRTYLDNNGYYSKNMLYVGDVYQGLTPNIDAFIEEWGFKLGRSMVAESQDAQSQYVTLVSDSSTGQTYNVGASLANIAEDVFSAGLDNTKLPIVAPQARPIELLWETNGQRTTTVLLNTSSTSYLYPYAEEVQKAQDSLLSDETTAIGEDGIADETTVAEETAFNEETAEKKPQAVLAVGEKSKVMGEGRASSKVMVMSSASMIDYAVMVNKSYNNSEYVINSLNVMTGKDSGIIVESKTFDSQTIAVSEKQLGFLKNLTMIVIPLTVLAIGLFVYIRRRNR